MIMFSLAVSADICLVLSSVSRSLQFDLARLYRRTFSESPDIEMPDICDELPWATGLWMECCCTSRLPFED